MAKAARSHKHERVPTIPSRILLRDVNLLFLIDVAQEISEQAHKSDNGCADGIPQMRCVAFYTGRVDEQDKLPDGDAESNNPDHPTQNIY